MNIDKVATLKGIKLLDTNIFFLRIPLFSEIYECPTFEDLPVESFCENINQIRNWKNFLKKTDFYSVEEVADEISVSRALVNEVMLHYFKTHFKFSKFRLKAGLSYISKITEAHRHNCRRTNKYREKRRSAPFYAFQFQYDALNLFAKETFDLEKEVRAKNIKGFFNSEELQKYKNYLSYFNYISKERGVVRDFSKRYSPHFKNKWHCDFETDQKLVAAAHTLANKGPVILVSSDSDLERMTSFFYWTDLDKEKFKIKSPKNPVLIFSEINENPELIDIRDFDKYNYFRFLRLEKSKS